MKRPIEFAFSKSLRATTAPTAPTAATVTGATGAMGTLRNLIATKAMEAAKAGFAGCFSAALVFCLLGVAESVWAVDQCTGSLDPWHPVVARFNAMSLAQRNGRPLHQSSWVSCGGRAVQDESLCAGKPIGLRFAFEADSVTRNLAVKLTGLSDGLLEALAVEQAKSTNPVVVNNFKMLISRVLKDGLTFSAQLCLRSANEAYVDLVGTGSAKGRSYRMNLTFLEAGAIALSEPVDTRAAGSSGSAR